MTAKTAQDIGTVLGTNKAEQTAARVKGVKRRNGMYRLVIDGEERQFVSVTNVLGVLNKPALLTWAAKTAANLVLEDPETYHTAEAAAGGIYKSRDGAADRGSTVHSAVEAMLNGASLDIDSMPSAVQPYAHAFASWFETVRGNFELIYSECTVYSTVHGYAGTTDLIGKLGGTTYLIDFKTGLSLYPEVGLQLAAYRHADLWLPKTIACPQHAEQGCKTCSGFGRMKGELSKAQPIERTAALLLKKDGKYRFEEFTAPLDVFLALKRVNEWQRSA